MSRPNVQRSPSTNLGVGNQQRSLEGKLAIVTGASRGIGVAIAEHLAAKGANILVNYTSESSKDPAEKLARSLEDKYGVKAVLAQADMGSEKGPAYAIEVAKNNFKHPKTGNFQIDIIVANAGIAGFTAAQDIDAENFAQIYNINVRGPAFLVGAAIPYLPNDRSGRIVLISSVSSTICPPGQTLYAGTKAALEAMGRVWSRELNNRCTVNSLTPGPVETDMWNSVPEEFKVAVSTMQANTPLAQYLEGIDPPEWKELQEKYNGRWAQPSDIAGLVGMICSQESAWMTGCSLSANGGLTFSKA